jgi:hypothetical protein
MRKGRNRPMPPGPLKVVPVYLDVITHQRLRVVASLKGMSLAAFCREAVRAAVGRSYPRE